MNRKASFLIAAAICLAATLPAQAQTYWINTGEGLWEAPGNWNNGVPSSSIAAQVNNGGTARIHDGSSAACRYLYLGYAAATDGNVAMDGSTLDVVYSINVGYEGTGSFVQTDGDNTVNSALGIGSLAGSSGSYELNGGTLVVGSTEYVGIRGLGTFTQRGGTHTVGGTILFSYDGEGAGYYELIDGDLIADTEDTYRGGTGCSSFAQSGGTNTVNTLYLEGPVDCGTTYELSGGELVVNSVEYLAYHNAGSFIQTGGTHTVSGTFHMGYGNAYYYPEAQADYLLEAGTLHVQGTEYLCYESYGNAFTQTGGTHTVDGTLHIGYLYAGGGGPRGTGVYYMQGGRLEAGNLRLSQAGAAGTLYIQNADAEIHVNGEMSFSGLASFGAVPGAKIHFTGTLVNLIGYLDPVRFQGFSDTELIAEGGGGHFTQFEVAGTDYGARMIGFYENSWNFAWAGLTLGGDDVGQVQLIDNEGSAGAVLYVETLTVGAASVLDLNGITLYYVSGAIHPDATILNGTPVQIIPGDIDGDGDVELSDLAELLGHYGAADGDPEYDLAVDINGDGVVDLSDLAELLGHYGDGT